MSETGGGFREIRRQASFASRMLKKYSKISGAITSIILNGSTVGVMTAAMIAMPTTAKRQPFSSMRALTRWIFARKKMISGVSKLTPSQKSRAVTNGMYAPARQSALKMLD